MKKALEEAGGENKVEMIKLNVFVTIDETFDGSTEARRSVETMLRDRFNQNKSLLTESNQENEFKLSSAASDGIKQICKTLKECPESQSKWVEDSENILEDFGVTRDLLVNEKSEEGDILEKIQQLADLNSTHFARLLVSQGYDLWL